MVRQSAICKIAVRAAVGNALPQVGATCTDPKRRVAPRGPEGVSVRRAPGEGSDRSWAGQQNSSGWQRIGIAGQVVDALDRFGHAPLVPAGTAAEIADDRVCADDGFDAHVGGLAGRTGRHARSGGFGCAWKYGFWWWLWHGVSGARDGAAPHTRPVQDVSRFPARGIHRRDALAPSPALIVGSHPPTCLVHDSSDDAGGRPCHQVLLCRQT